LERALTIREKALGPDHPHTATSLSSLAFLLQAKGEAEPAMGLFEQSLAIYEKGLGREHPNTNRVRCHLARLRLVTGAPAEAVSLGLAAVSAHDKILGSDSSWTLDSVRVTAEALHAVGRSDDAVALLARYGLGRERV